MTTATLAIGATARSWTTPQIGGSNAGAAETIRVPESGEWTLVGEPLQDQDLRNRISTALHNVAEFIGADEAFEIDDFGFVTIESSLETAQERLAGLTHSQNVTVLAPTLTRLIELLAEVTALQVQVSRDRVRQTHTRYGTVRNALSRLQGVKSIEQMLDQGPAALRRCGFDRVIISRIDESTWTVERVYIHGDPEWAHAIAQAGLDHPMHIDNMLVEGEMVRRRAPILVDDVQSNSRTNAAIRTASLSRSYVAAPIMAEGRVIGMLHADCYNSGRHVDADDLAVLAMFTEGFSYALGRAALIERLHLARNEIQRMARDVATAADSLCTAQISFRRPLSDSADQTAPPVAASLAANTRVEALLSRREMDVLSLMTQGKSNRDIATQLVIAEGTAKTHVKNVLRKLKASNRAEAVFRYMRMAALEG
ncbi:MAG: LuxR C-terminal-related transcriptional regulator [Candidatus Nanopelagicales bacterium]